MARVHVVTGASSGIGAATADRLRLDGDAVIGVDLAGSDIDADLSTPQGRRAAIDAIRDMTETLDGVVTCAGLSGLPGRPGDILASLNFFGSVELIEGLHDLLARSAAAAVVAISSNSTTTAPGVSLELVDACTERNEEAAREIANEIGSLRTYPSTKTAICRWVRATSVTPQWIGEAITVNAVVPGVTETPMVDETRSDPVIGPHFDNFPIPAGAPTSPDQIAGAITFLLGPDARFMCGSLLFVDGGTDALIRPNDWPSPLQL